jgi:Crp-like helix-turn-helix domain
VWKRRAESDGRDLSVAIRSWMTQELIASMLAVRREGITEAAGKLQHAGLIHYSRGPIDVIDRTSLEGRTCACYAVVKKECDRLLPDLTAS